MKYGIMNTVKMKNALIPAVSVVLSAAFIAGCKVMEEASLAQEQVKKFSDDSVVAQFSEPIDLGGTTLSGLVEFALKRRPSIKIQEYALKNEILLLKQLAASSPLINKQTNLIEVIDMSLSGGYSASSKSVLGLGNLSWNTSGNAGATLSLELLVYDFGRYDAKFASQVEKIVAAEQEILSTKYDVFRNVATSYFTFLEKRALLEVAYTNESEYVLHLQQAKERHRHGVAKDLDVLRAKLDLAQARELTVNADNEVRTSGAELVRALGLCVHEANWKDSLNFKGNALQAVKKGFPESKFALLEAFNIACTNSPLMRIKRARLRALSSDVDYAKADLKPSFSASASLSWTDPLWVWNWGVKGLWSFFQGFSKTSQLERAVVSMRSAAAEVQNAEQALSRDLEVAISKRDDARESRTTARESFAQARQNYEQVRIQYKLGEANRVDFSVAVADFVKSWGNRISAFYQGQRAEAEIFALIGMFPEYEEKIVTEKDL